MSEPAWTKLIQEIVRRERFDVFGAGREATEHRDDNNAEA